MPLTLCQIGELGDWGLIRIDTVSDRKVGQHTCRNLDGQLLDIVRPRPWFGS